MLPVLSDLLDYMKHLQPMRHKHWIDQGEHIAEGIHITMGEKHIAIGDVVQIEANLILQL